MEVSTMHAPEQVFKISNTTPLFDKEKYKGLAEAETYSKTVDASSHCGDARIEKSVKADTKSLAYGSAKFKDPTHDAIFQLNTEGPKTYTSEKLIEAEAFKSDTFTQAEIEAPDYRSTKITNIVINSITKPTGPLSELHHYYKALGKDSDGKERDVDALYVKRMFEKQTAAGLRNLKITQDETYELFIKHLNDDKTLTDYDSFLFVFLTYLGPDKAGLCEPKIHFGDSIVPLTQILNDLKSIESMLGKPKVLIVQADCHCDGMSVQKHAKGFQPREEVKYKTVKIPTDGDILVMTSTTPRAPSAPDSTASLPSPLVQAFCEVMDMNLNRVTEEQDDFMTLTVKINARFVKLFQEKHKKVVTLPMVTSTLRKQLFL